MNTFCAYFNKKSCQSCGLIEMNYADQIKHKERVLLNALNVSADILLPTFTSPEQGMRNKAKLSVTGTIENPIIGIYGENNLDQGVELLNCPIHHPAINSILTELKCFITTVKLMPYQVSTRTGELKSLIIYTPGENQEMYLRFVLRSKEALDRIKKHLPELLDKFPFLTSVSVNIQPIPHAILEGKEEVILFGNGYIKVAWNDFHLKLTPQAFVQTNTQVAQELYHTASNWIRDLNVQRMAELFCGQGAFSFSAQSHIKQGLGIEINSDAIKIANSTAQENNLSHLRFLSADAQDMESELKKFDPELVLVNPPRRGLAQSAAWLTDGKYPYIIYSSCSYESLAHDLKTLSRSYQIKHIKIFDMFPHTEHFETLVLLTSIKV